MIRAGQFVIGTKIRCDHPVDGSTALPHKMERLGCRFHILDHKRKTQIPRNALRPIHAAAFPSRPVLVPQNEVNRKVTLASPPRALQPNNALDRDSRNPNPDALANRQRMAQIPYREGVKTPKGATLAGAPHLFRIRSDSARSGLCDGLHARGKTRHFPRDGVFVQHTLGDATGQFRLGYL
jgi:hypothetical protein